MIPARTLLLLALLVAGCSFERGEHPQACERTADCPEGARCYGRFCIAEGQGGGACGASAAQIETCYEGPEGTMGIGACAAGQRLCVESAFSACLGQVLPALELCNGKDDDCNGAIDDITAGAACDTHLQGACADGVRVCREGVEFCQPARMSQTEACNGEDDDCDGMTDELAGRPCYPSGDGCAMDAQGIWQCNGLCATGTTSCEAGSELCSGAIMPVDEACTGQPVAQDEDCDGAIDETCPCSASESRACYAGPLGTSGHGKCKSGMQGCDGTTWGPCIGQVVPVAETCDNNGGDDDCNDVEDDVPGLGSACIAFWSEGQCRNGTYACTGFAEPRCSPGEASAELCDELDQDCDGHPTNGFDFGSDETCGACDVQCAGDETCCVGGCIDVAQLDTDEANCGACGNACGQGQTCCQGDCVSYTGAMPPACACANDCGDRTCCGMDCRDLENDGNNCGACGRKCGRGSMCENGTCR